MQQPHAWVRAYVSRREGQVSNTYTADYSLRKLMELGLVDVEKAHQLLEESLLEDYFWQMTWPEDFETPDEMLETNIRMAQGFAVFVHGWTGDHSIWEEIPGRVVSANRRLISIAVDHNGFGRSRFTDSTPDLDVCNPPACMSVLQRVIDLLRIRRQAGDPTQKVINFVGHSMGAATLFYLNPIYWKYGECTRLALAPALLLDDDLYRAFFTTLGIGISILERFRGLNIIGNAVKPTMVGVLCQGASERVKQMHSSQYDDTARGVTGATFQAMGRLKNREIAQFWDTFKVTLAHKDRLVGLMGMMDLLAKLEFPVANTRVVPGTHYFFSIGSENPANAFLHAQNREIVVQDILDMHQTAVDMQKTGKKYG